MSNYIYGFFTASDRAAANIAEAVRRQSILGFHLIGLDDIPDVPGFPRSPDLVYFNLSDNNETMLSTYLIFEEDWAINYALGGRLPHRLADRIALIADAVKMVAGLSQSAKIGLWLSEVDQLEGVARAPLSSLYDTIVSDFKTRGIPCLLYEVVP